MRFKTASADMDFSEAKRRATAADRRPGSAHDKGFPPLSISSPAFLTDGSDKMFRQLVYKLLSLSALILKSRDYFAAYIGVTSPQFSMMMVVAEAGSVTIGQVAAALHVANTFVTAETGKLEKKGLVEKRPSPFDARSTLVSLTSLGVNLIREVGPVRRLINDTVYGRLTSAQVQQLRAIVGIMHEDAVRALHLLDSPEHQRRSAPSLQMLARKPRSKETKPR